MRKQPNDKVNRDLSIRDMLKITRSLYESENKKSVYDQPDQEQRFLNNFNDMNVHVKFNNLIVTDDYVFWGGTINGVIQFIYKVTADKQKSGVEFNYLEDFSPDNPENDLIISRIESYYNDFYQYWNENVIQ